MKKALFALSIAVIGSLAGSSAQACSIFQYTSGNCKVTTITFNCGGSGNNGWEWGGTYNVDGCELSTSSDMAMTL